MATETPDTEGLEAAELLEVMAKEPTLNRFFNNDPRDLSDGALREYIASERRKRALFIQKDQK